MLDLTVLLQKRKVKKQTWKSVMKAMIGSATIRKNKLILTHPSKKIIKLKR
jgi:hypothetical protein